MKKWVIEFPTYQYKQDVKALAKENGLKIVDARYQGNEPQCDNAPSLTLKSQKQLKAEAEESVISSELANKLVKNLNSISAEEVKALAKYLKMEYTTKDETLDAIKEKIGK